MSLKDAPTYHEGEAEHYVVEAEVINNKALTRYDQFERATDFALANHEMLKAIHHDLCRIAAVLERP